MLVSYLEGQKLDALMYGSLLQFLGPVFLRKYLLELP